MKAALGALGGMFGTAFFLVITVLGIFSVPLSAVALIRWFEFGFWSAIIAATVLWVVPFIGWIAGLVFSIAGAYFLIAADFDWDRATLTFG